MTVGQQESRMEVPAGESASREGDILNRQIRTATGLDAEKHKASALNRMLSAFHE
jgi:hypothetical protein